MFTKKLTVVLLILMAGLYGCTTSQRSSSERSKSDMGLSSILPTEILGGSKSKSQTEQSQSDMGLSSILPKEIVGISPKAPSGRFQGERVLAHSTFSMLPKETLQGSNYQIAESVQVKEYQYVFTIKSDFGEITANGRHMLDLRLRELKSIEAAQKLAKDPHFVNGILSPLKDTEKGLELIINEPFESLERAPKGLNLMANQYIDPADRRAGSPDRRRIATKLDCDPETNNPVLKKLLDKMTLEMFTGSLITQAAMSYVPGLSIPSTTAKMKELIVNSPPSVINKQIERELEIAGVEKSIRSRFRYSTVFTTVQRLQLMRQFRALRGVQNRGVLIEIAANAHNEAEALSAIYKGKMLADIQQRQRIWMLKFTELFPLVVLGNGTNVLVCPYDYVTNTRELEEYINTQRASNPNVTTVLIIAGGVSPAARKTIESVSIRIVEEGTPDW